MPWDIVGHHWAVQALQRDLALERVRHAYLFTGPEGIGKSTLALTFARALLCERPDGPCGACRACRLAAREAHPDLLLTRPVVSGKRILAEKIPVEAIRRTIYDLALRPVEARRRVACLLDFDAANAAAQNAFLKTLEEPPPNVVILLTAESPDQLLPTIVSRCQAMALRPLPLEAVRRALVERWQAPADRAELLAHLSGGRPGWAARALQEESLLEEREARLADLDRLLASGRADRFAYAEQVTRSGSLDRQQAVLSLWASYWRDLLCLAAGSSAPLTHIDRRPALQHQAAHLNASQIESALRSLTQASDQLARNANSRLVLEVMFLDWPRLI